MTDVCNHSIPAGQGLSGRPSFPNTCCCDLLHVINSFTGLSHSPISGQYNLYSAAWLVHFTKDEQYWSEANIHLLKRQTMDWSMDALRCFPDGGHHLPILVIVLAVDPVISCAWFQTLQNRFFLAPKWAPQTHQKSGPESLTVHCAPSRFQAQFLTLKMVPILGSHWWRLLAPLFGVCFGAENVWPQDCCVLFANWPRSQ